MFSGLAKRPLRTTHGGWLLPLLVLALVTWRVGTAETETDAQLGPSVLRVVDADGKPVAKFELYLAAGDTPATPWLAGQDGLASLHLWLDRTKAESFDVVVRAEGFASSLAHFVGAELEKLRRSEAVVTLDPGEVVTVALRLPEGLTWPKGAKPLVYFDALRSETRMDWQNTPSSVSAPTEADPNLLGTVSPQPGAVQLRLSAKSAPFRVAVQAPGFLRFFEHGPLTLASFKEDRFEIDVPKPGRLEVKFQPAAAEGQTLPFDTAKLELAWGAPKHVGYVAGSKQTKEPWENWNLTDLAPGDYLVMLNTTPKADSKDLSSEEIHTAANPGKFKDDTSVSVEADHTAKVEFDYTPLDPDSLRGECTADLHVLKMNGTAAAGLKIVVQRHIKNYGFFTVFAGETNESGVVTVTGLSDGAPEGVGKPFSVRAVKRDESGSTGLGRIGIPPGTSSQEFTFRLPPDEGDPAPDIELLNMQSGEAQRLSDFRGKIVVLDFWATWCGPCQEPIKHMNQMVVDKAAGWKDRVVVIPLSIDDNVEILKEHVFKRGWTNVDHFWSGQDEAKGFQAPAARAFALIRSGVPTTLLIDRDGTILWRGNPGSAGLEKLIDEALAR